MENDDQKSKVIVCICRAITGNFSRSLIDNLKLLEKYHSSIDVLTTAKTDRGALFISDYLDIHVKQSLTMDYEKLIANYSNWEEIYQSIDVEFLKDYSTLYIFGGIHFPQSNLTRFSKRSKTFPKDDKGQLKFRQVSTHIINVMAIHKAHVLYDIPLHEFSYDTDEYSTKLFNVDQNPNNYKNYHVYDIPKYNMNRLDSLQYFFQTKKTDIFNVDNVYEKIYDLTFGYTLYDYGNRPKYINFIEELANKFENRNIFIKNAIDKSKSNTVNKTIYLDYIEKSKYTIIIPSYDEYCFSFYRFIESIQRDCLPILHEGCFTDDVERSFGYSLAHLKMKDIPDEETRVKWLNELKDIFLNFKQGFITDAR